VDGGDHAKQHHAVGHWNRGRHRNGGYQRQHSWQRRGAIVLLGPWVPTKESTSLQIINIVIGALVAAFATVVNFWLGSSQGSRTKDQQSAEMMERSAKQNAEILEKSSKQVEGLQSTISKVIDRKAPGEATKPTTHFAQCADFVMRQEDIKRRYADPGGVTQFGLSLDELKDLRNDKNLTADDLNRLTREQACEIYRSRYWNVLRCDELPVGVDLVVFDFAVDEGPPEAAKALQDVVGAGTDGSVGPVTISAAKMMSSADVVRKVSQRRTSKDRSREVEQKAQQMIASAGGAGG
jgi:hypothetical protein